MVRVFRIERDGLAADGEHGDIDVVAALEAASANVTLSVRRDGVGVSVAVADDNRAELSLRSYCAASTLNDVEVELADADAVGHRDRAADRCLRAADGDSALARGRVELRADAVGTRQVSVLAEQCRLVDIARGVRQRGGIDELRRAALRVGQRGGDGSRAVAVGRAYGGGRRGIGFVSLLIVDGHLFALRPSHVEDFLTALIDTCGDGASLRAVVALGCQRGGELDVLAAGCDRCRVVDDCIIVRAGCGCQQSARCEQCGCDDAISAFHHCFVVFNGL
ncbi:MAG: hypothetical protein IJ069_01580 [Prevotella sp.]|nr:hypothetical protein [Prevotella sp.]